MRLFSALLFSLLFIQWQPLQDSVPARPDPVVTDTTLESLLRVPAQWYAGFPLRAKAVELWRIHDQKEGRVVRITPEGGAPWERFIYSENDSRPFYGGPPPWSDDSFEVGLLNVGEHEVTFKIEIFPLSIDDRTNPIASTTVKRKVRVVPSIDEVCPEPYSDKAVAARLQITERNGDLRLFIPEDLRPSIALRVRLLRNSRELGYGQVYHYPADPQYKAISRHGFIDQWNDPSKSPIEYVLSIPRPEGPNAADTLRPDAVELIGDAEVAARAGMKRYWCGRVLIPLRADPALSK